MMKRRNRAIALALAGMIGINGIAFPATVEAEETVQEYVVMAEDASAYEEVVEDYENAIVTPEQAEETAVAEEAAALTEATQEVLEEEHVVVLELTESEAKKLEKESDIITVEENILFHGNETAVGKTKKELLETADYSDKQWNLEAINYIDDTQGEDTIKVAVLDSGVSYTSDLYIAESYDLIHSEEEEINPLFADASGHGTAMAGMIGALDNGDGIKGVYPNARLVSIQILDGNNQATLSQVIAGIYKAIETDCKIINMSFGTEVDSAALHEAVRAAYDAGILMIAAAGNQEGASVEYPAAYEEVMAVGASDASGNKLEGTSDGTEIEVFAPGSQVPSIGDFSGILISEGTSISAAQVSGVAAMLWAQDETKPAGFIRSLIRNSARNMEENGMSDAGLLDMEQALNKYPELELVYSEEVYEYTDLRQDSEDAETFDDVKLVNGSWGGKVHQISLDLGIDSYLELDAIHYQIMRLGSRLPDIYRKDKKEENEETNEEANEEANEEDYAASLHGRYNYVRTLRVLFLTAKYVKRGQTSEDAVNNAADKVGLQNDNDDDQALKEALIHMLETSYYDDLYDDDSLAVGSKDAFVKAEESKLGRYYKMIGIAAHLIGDTFAHRVIVPEYTVSGTIGSEPVTLKINGSEPNTLLSDIEDDLFAEADEKVSRFGKKHFKTDADHTRCDDATLKKWAKRSGKYEDEICKQWKCFKRAVRLGVIETRDIGNFVKTETKDYTDNPWFCPERYDDAQWAVAMFMNLLDYGYNYDGIFILEPFNDTVKLNNFKRYAEEAGQDTSGHTDAEWELISTPELY